MQEESDDPEQAYRRGYQQGAWAAYEAVQAKLPRPDAEALSNWIQLELFKWRLAAQRGESRRSPDGVTSDIVPPRFKR